MGVLNTEAAGRGWPRLFLDLCFTKTCCNRLDQRDQQCLLHTHRDPSVTLLMMHVVQIENGRFISGCAELAGFVTLLRMKLESPSHVYRFCNLLFINVNLYNNNTLFFFKMVINKKINRYWHALYQH